jgi:ComF family protein
VAPLLYQPPVDDLVASLKYHQQFHLGPVLTEILAQAVRREGSGVQVLLPVPMPGPGLRERGFNQAAELARHLSLQLKIPWSVEYLSRVRGNRHQQSLRRNQRRRNVRGVFACRGKPPARVALIDDVMTTGATAEEASRILKRAGVARVEVWTVARTSRDHWTFRGQKR